MSGINVFLVVEQQTTKERCGMEYMLALAEEVHINGPMALHTHACVHWQYCKAPALCTFKGGWCFKGHYRRELWLDLKSFDSTVFERYHSLGVGQNSRKIVLRNTTPTGK